ncbi:MAG: Ig-like domain-containing protein [Isosphaeraceae bacterium]|nr:Ig-like domain-containing protein [Isosphaeraceae bacterium]
MSTWKSLPGFGRESATVTLRKPHRRRLWPVVEGMEARALLSVTIQEFPTGLSSVSDPWITEGPDGNLWFTVVTSTTTGSIARITPAGAVTDFPITPYHGPNGGITTGSDGALWFTELYSPSGPYGGLFLGSIGRITTTGQVTDYPNAFNGDLAEPYAITAGPDHNVWFTEINATRVGRITPGGQVTEFSQGLSPLPTSTSITPGPDGALWFVEQQTSQHPNLIGRITTSGQITEFGQGIGSGGVLQGITAGPDGALWFTMSNDTIGRITTSGQVTEFKQGITPGSDPFSIVAGPDNALWFTEPFGDRIGRITTSGQVTEYSAGLSPGAFPLHITNGPNGTLWFTEGGDARVGEINVPAAPAPTVEQVERFGFHLQPTTVALTFSQPLDSTSAQNVANYTITGPGGRTIPIASAVYDASAQTVTLSPRSRLNLHRRYTLAVNGTPPAGVAGASGAPLNGNGTPGTYYVTTLVGFHGQPVPVRAAHSKGR